MAIIHRQRKDYSMDLLYIGIVLAFFGLSWGLIRLCEVL